MNESFVIRGTHRAVRGGDSPQTAWVRDEDGRMNLAEVEELTVDIQRDNHKILTIPATGDAEGRVDFTVTSANIKQKLSLLGLFRLYVRADGQVIYTGLLEVLG